MTRVGRRTLFKLKLPIRNDVKKWLQKWLGQEDVEVTAGVNEIGNVILLACVKGQPSAKDKSFKSADLDDFIFVNIQIGTYIPDEKILQLNQTLYSYMISQIVAVAIARKQSDDIRVKSPQTATYEYYQNHFGIEMTTYALEKASQRLQNQRQFPSFATRK